MSEASNPDQQRSSDAHHPSFQDPLNLDNSMSVTEMFGPRFTGGVIELVYTLKTSRMKQFYKRDFLYVSQMLYSIERQRMIPGIDTARLDASEEALAKKLDAVKKLLRKGTQDGNALAAQAGHADMQIQYPSPVKLRAPIISPYAREFMEILVLADDAYSALHTAHLLGLIETRAKFGRESTYRKAIRSISGFVREQRIQLLKALQQMRANAGAENDQSSVNAINEVITSDAQQLIAQGNADEESRGAPSAESDLSRIASESQATTNAMEPAATAEAH